MAASESNSDVAQIHNIIHKRGDTFGRKFRFWQDEAKTVKEDITANTYAMQIRKPKDDTVLMSFAMAEGLSIENVNELVLSKTAAQMAVKADIYTYDIQKTTGGTVITVIKGNFTITDDRTK
jgi:hypothetical protein